MKTKRSEDACQILLSSAELLGLALTAPMT
jgi:hypothetical protein